MKVRNQIVYKRTIVSEGINSMLGSASLVKNIKSLDPVPGVYATFKI